MAISEQGIGNQESVKSACGEYQTALRNRAGLQAGFMVRGQPMSRKQRDSVTNKACGASLMNHGFGAVW
jgi:hypothetical protein